MCCGVVPILFGWFFRVPSLHALVFIRKTFCDLFLPLFFCLWFFKSSKREERQARERCMVCRVCTIELCCSQRTKNHHKFKCFQVKLYIFLHVV